MYRNILKLNEEYEVQNREVEINRLVCERWRNNAFPSQSRRAAVDGAGSGRVQTHKRGLQLSQRGTGRDTGVKKYPKHSQNL